MRTLAALLLLLPSVAAADIISEIGAGVKLRNTSYLMLPACEQALVTVPSWPDNPRGVTHTYSCGGDDPLFIGWPIAWQSSFSDVFTVRVGWLHFSHWFDGRGSHELHMDAIASTLTVNWSEIGRRRK